jgi:pyridoxamine 5'-phosphate oxidase
MAIDNRMDYQAPPLDFAALPRDPLALFLMWFREVEGSGIAEPNAMALATVSAAGIPSVRMVLLKSADERGFTFFTNYESSKARDMAETGRAGVVFFWQQFHRQVRVSGRVAKVAREESAEYFATRPRAAQLGAWASRQSAVLGSREDLEREYARQQARFEGGDVPLPPHWGGFRLTADRMEFWQGQPSRLHDRANYRLEEGTWVLERLSP